MSTLRLNLVQSDIIWENPPANIARTESLLTHAPHADIILLPEMWSTGFTMHPENAAEDATGHALSWMMEYARTSNAVIAGSMATRHHGRFYNRFYWAFPDGHLEWYDKKHLFSYGGEDKPYTAGTTQVSIEIKGWNIMPIVCYDLRFPAWCRNRNDYDLLVVVANWPVPRIHHWDALVRARAIENQCYVTAVNRVGSDGNGLQYTGHSSVYNMNGDLLHTLKEQEGVIPAVLNKEELNEYRNTYKFLQDQDVFEF